MTTYTIRRVVLTAATALAATLTACGTPVGLQDIAKDGQSAELSANVFAQNFLVISTGQGESGALIGTLVNRSDEDMLVDIEIDGTTAVPNTITISANSTTEIGSAADDALPVTLSTMPCAPGDTLNIRVSAPQTGGIRFPIPVLDGTLPAYADQLPTPSATFTANP